jgi:antitoxin VapB
VIIYFSTVLNIKSPEAHRLAKQLADARKSSLTEAVTHALAESLRTVREPERGIEAILAEVAEVQALVAALPDRDVRSADEVLGYDERGLPA